MSQNAFIGNGVTLSYKISPAVTFTTVGQLISVGLNPKFGEVEVPLLGLSAKEYLSTLLESGEPTFTIAYNGTDTTYQALIAQFLSGNACAWKLLLPDGGNFTFNAFLKEFPVEGIEQESVIEINASMRISGTISWSAT